MKISMKHGQLAASVPRLPKCARRDKTNTVCGRHICYRLHSFRIHFTCTFCMGLWLAIIFVKWVVISIRRYNYLLPLYFFITFEEFDYLYTLTAFNFCKINKTGILINAPSEALAWILRRDLALQRTLIIMT